MSTRLRQRGVTLVELIIFIVIISIAVAGILGVMSLTTRHSADPLRRKQALMIAESLMEEVQMAAFTFCDPTSPDADTATSTADCDIPENWGQSAPEPVGERPFDNVNDYVSAPGVAQPAFNDASGTLVDASGNPFSASGYSATVSIQSLAMGECPPTVPGRCIGGASAVADTDALLITVSVAYEGGSIVLDGYRTRYAPR